MGECPKVPRVPRVPKSAQSAQKCPEHPKMPIMARKCPELPNLKNVYLKLFFWDTLYNLKVDYISDSTTNIERALKMESVMSSFRLLMAENNRYVKLAFLQLNRYMATSICAKQPQSVQNNLNLCKTTSIRAEK